MAPWRLIPESLGRERLIPERSGSAAVTSESLGRSGVDSNSSLASRALSSKSLPDSGWRTLTRSLEGLSSKSLSDSAAGTSAEEPTSGLERTAVSPEPEAGARKPWSAVSSLMSVTSESLAALTSGSGEARRTSESLAPFTLSGTSRTSESLGSLPLDFMPMITELEPVTGLGGTERSSKRMS